MITVLTVVSAWLEWQLVHTDTPILSDVVRWLYTNKTRRLIASIALSAFIGTLFGAAGVIVFIGGLFSTFVIQPFYLLEQSGWLDKAKQAKADFQRHIWDRRELIRRRIQKVWSILTFLSMPLVWFFRGVFWLLDRAPSKKASV